MSSIGRKWALPGKRGQRCFGEPEEPTDACEDHDEPYGIDGCLGVPVDALPPAGSRERIIPCKCKHDTGRIHALRRASHVLESPRVSSQLKSRASGVIYICTSRFLWTSGRRRVEGRRHTHLHNDDAAPYSEHAPFAQDIQEQLAHRQWQRALQEIRDGCSREGRSDKEEPAKRRRGTDADQNGDGCTAGSASGLF